MAPMLRLTIPAFPPEPMLGNCDIVGGCLALTLESVRERMIPRRDHLYDRYHLPPDPTAFPDSDSEWRKQDRLRCDTLRHREYLRLAAEVAELDDPIVRGAHLEVTALLFRFDCTEIEAWSGIPILTGRFEWAECAACGVRYSPVECRPSDWSQVADPLAGIGGKSR